MAIKLCSGAAVVAVALAFASMTAAADPVGLWLDKDGTTIRVHHCGGGLCGTIVGRIPRLDPATGRPWTDKYNPDAARRERPLSGVQVFIAMKAAGAGKWSGRLYDSDTGKSYSGHLLDQGRDSLRVEGCVMGMCGGENLKRAK